MRKDSNSSDTLAAVAVSGQAEAVPLGDNDDELNTDDVSCDDNRRRAATNDESSLLGIAVDVDDS